MTKTDKMTAEMQTASYSRNIEKGETGCDCIRCGKAITGQTLWVEGDGSYLVGMFPVGADCAKKLSKLGVKVVAE